MGVDFPIQLLAGTRVGDIHVLVNKFLLDEQRQGVVVEDATDDRLRRANGVPVPGHLGAFLENGLEEDVLPHQFRFALVTDPAADFSPHVSDDDDILEGVVTAELSEHAEVLPRQPRHPEI